MTDSDAMKPSEAWPSTGECVLGGYLRVLTWELTNKNVRQINAEKSEAVTFRDSERKMGRNHP